MALWSSKKKVSSSSRLSKAKNVTKVSPYHCVELVNSDNACDAAMEVSGKRFLSSEAPFLPLRECDQANCTCRFKHHDDRRGRKGASEDKKILKFDTLRKLFLRK